MVCGGYCFRMPSADCLGIGGSPRPGGNTDILIDRVLAGVASRGIATDRAFVRDYCIQPCTGCERCRTDLTCSRFRDGMHLLYPRIEAAKGLVLGCPTYHYNVTAQMKAFIDRLYPYFLFTDDRPRRWESRLAHQDRKAVVVAVCEQEDSDDMGWTLEAMVLPLEALGYEVLEAIPVIGHFDRGAVASDDDALARAEAAGQKLAAGLER